MNDKLDLSRHLEIFYPEDFNPERIDVIGVGSIGSSVVMQLAKLGIENIHVWDFDKIEAHNIPNQSPYSYKDEGKLKVEALKERVEDLTSTIIHTHAKKVEGTERFGKVVFLLVDTIKDRKIIFEKSLKLSFYTELMVETRMDVDNFRLYAINPNNPDHITEWEKATQYSDEDATVSACGAHSSMGPTAEILSGLAVWQFIRWWNVEQGIGEETDENLEQEILFSLRGQTHSYARNFFL